MALTTKRIIALPSQTDPQEGDYLAIDNAQGGTHKIPVGRIGVEVDDTLTEAGKAADAKATGDALDEIRSQIEVTGTASGAIATFADGADAPTKSCIATIVPKQAGSGTPSPENERPISGWESVSVMVSPTEDEADATTTTTSLGRTVYGGTVDVVSGLLTVDRAMVDLNSLSYERITNGSVYIFQTSIAGKKYPSTTTDFITSCYEVQNSSGFGLSNKRCTTGTGSSAFYFRDDDYTDAASFKASLSGQTLVYHLVTPQTYTLTPTQINTLLGENNVWADSGDVSVVYVRDLNIAINNLIGE